jgi:hypothetical protein
MRRLALSLAALVAAVFAVSFAACSGQGSLDGERDGSTASADGAASAGDSGASFTDGGSSFADGGNSLTDGGNSLTDGGNSLTDGGSSLSDSGGPLADGGCVGTKSTGQRQPLDMYIMLDQSGSMMEPAGSSGTKWSAVTHALSAFLEQTGMDGISVGLQLFGLRDPGGLCATSYGNTCRSDSDCGSCGPCRRPNGESRMFCTAGYSQESCDPTVYATPMVEIGDIATVKTTIGNALQSLPAETYTPTSAALQGAIDHAKEWATSHPRDVVIAVLATDGEPTECDVDLQHIQAVAAAGAGGSPKVLTFVIGVGDSLPNLNGIAAAGGSSSALLVDTSGDVSAEFLAALNKIRGETVGCAYLIPPAPSGQQLDYAQVNVQFAASAGATAASLVQVQSAATCGTLANAWRYDDPMNPKQIILCPETCKAVEAAPTSTVDVVLGCQTVIGPN